LGQLEKPAKENNNPMRLLGLKEFPYVFTLLIAALAWTLTHLVDRLSESSSILTYEMIENTALKSYTFRFENVSKDQIYSRFDAIISTDSGKLITAELVQPRIYNIANQAPLKLEGAFRFYIDNLFPGNVFTVEITCECTKEPRIFFDPPKTQPVRIEPPSYASFIIKNEFELLLALVVCWILLLVAYGLTMTTRLNNVLVSPEYEEVAVEPGASGDSKGREASKKLIHEKLVNPKRHD
jgi:hypothetical protein